MKKWTNGQVENILPTVSLDWRSGGIKLRTDEAVTLFNST